MSLDINQGVEENEDDLIFNEMQIDAIGEVMNISMGSAATAVSTMLDKKVVITTPRVTLKEVELLDYSTLEPAILVKIIYVEGIEGSNIMMFRQRDMQMILNQLMGIEGPPSDDFIFDDLSISAACEVMNQMMGSSATALSNFLGRTINISTPTAELLSEDKTFEQAVGIMPDKKVVAILFSLKIEDIMETEFISVMSMELAKMIVNQIMPSEQSETTSSQPQVQPQSTEPQPQDGKPVAPPQMPSQPQDSPTQMPQQPQATQPQMPPEGYPQQPQMDMYQQGMYPPQGMYPYPQQGMYPPQGMYPYPQQGMCPPQGMYPYPMQGMQREPQKLNVQNIQVPQFVATPPSDNQMGLGGNIDLIKNVPLGVSIEIGRTKRRIREIMDFTQGTVIELDKQAGAPVDIIVNGQLIARGDVVVIDDNFGVRVTEILNPNEIMQACKNIN